MLKGYRKIDKYLTNWCVSHGFNVKCRLDTDFGFNSEKGIVYYSLVVPQDQDELFCSLFRDRLTNVEKCDIFILSFFHEIGHYMTEDCFEDWEMFDYYDFTAKLDKKKKLTKADYKRYFLHPVEYNATIWGADYINNNVSIIEEFFNGLSPLLYEFAHKNKLELE